MIGRLLKRADKLFDAWLKWAIPLQMDTTGKVAVKFIITVSLIGGMVYFLRS